MYCTVCGTNNPANATFCCQCGVPFTNATQAKPVQQVQLVQPVQIVNTVPAVPRGPVKFPGKGLGIFSMILGILSLVLLCVWFISPFLALFGISFACFSKYGSARAGAPNGCASAGLACSFVTLGIYIVLIIIGLANI